MLSESLAELHTDPDLQKRYHLLPSRQINLVTNGKERKMKPDPGQEYSFKQEEPFIPQKEKKYKSESSQTESRFH
jgi:hypothetical protein